MKEAYVIGLDFGTDSVRALLVDTYTGKTLATSTKFYPRWAKGYYSDPSLSQFRQHPLDYLEALREALKEVLTSHPERKEFIRAISVDTTGSTPCLIDEYLQPLALKPEYENDPDAMFVLWKDHTAQAEAEAITAHCAKNTPNYAAYSGKHYSAEAFWAKVWHILRRNEKIRKDAFAAIDFCDWIPAVLTGCNNIRELKVGRCITGAKLLWAEEWGGYPPETFFAQLDPDLAKIAQRLSRQVQGCDKAVGHLSPEWAKDLGLPESILIGTGNIDSHSGAVGAGIMEGTMVLNLGTSACFMTVVSDERMQGRVIDGIFSQVKGSILPNMIGIEVGLSAFGDVYAWFKRILSWPLHTIQYNSFSEDKATLKKLTQETEDRIMLELNSAAQMLPLRPNAPIATDHLNGRRSPNPSATISGSLSGLTLSATPPEIYFALVEATAMATRRILEYLKENNVEINTLIGVGGISQKSPFVMQMLADVTGRTIEVSGCSQSCAFGSVIHAATVAGLYASVTEAQQALCAPTIRTYIPDPSKSAHFELRYSKYLALSEFSEQLF